MKNKMIRERNGCNDHTSGHERDGKARRSDWRKEEKGCRSNEAACSIALEESKSSQAQVDHASEMAVKQGSQSVQLNITNSVGEDVAVKNELKMKAREVLECYKNLSFSYLRLCEYIREKQVRPEMLSAVLSNEGFRKERISEIKRICFATDEIFNDFKNRITGWRATLERIRKNRDQREQLELQWNEFFRQFERQWVKAPPTRYYHQGPKQCLLMWHREDKSKVVEIEGWTIEIRKEINDRTTGN